MKVYAHSLITPMGEFSFAVNDQGAVIGTAFGDLKALQSRCDADEFIPDTVRTGAAAREISDYLDGRLTHFSTPVAPKGTAFQQRVWQALLAIPYGETRTYGMIAEELKTGMRAVGGACGANPVALIVPCHRVVGKRGHLTGFAFGIDTKQRLLELEGAA